MIYTTIPAMEKYFGSSIAKKVSTGTIKETVLLDPETTNVDTFVVQPSDLGGLNGAHVIAALNNAHPNVTCVYLYTKDNELDKIKRCPRLKPVRVPNYKDPSIKDSIESILEKEIKENPDSYNYSRVQKQEVEPVPVEQHNPNLVEQQPIPEPVVEEVLPLPDPVVEEAVDEDVSDLEKKYSNDPEKTPMEQYREALGRNQQTMADLKRSLEYNRIIANLQKENSEYQNTMSALDLIEQSMMSIYARTDLSTEDKIQMIIDKAREKMALKSSSNSILTDKVVKLIEYATLMAKEEYDRTEARVRESMKIIDSRKTIFYKSQDQLSVLLEERRGILDRIFVLMAELQNICGLSTELYADVVESYSEGVPSSNPRLAQVLEPSREFEKVPNLSQLLNTINQGLTNGRIALSSIEEKYKDLIIQVNKLCEKDSESIEFQRKFVEELKANRVEDAVTVSSMVQMVTNIFIGPENVGTRTTALAWAAMVSRTSNTLVLDLTGRDKFADYGYEAVELAEFMVERIQRPMLCVRGTVDEYTSISDIVSELKTRLNYYGNIVIILGYGQQSYLNEIANDALRVHFVTDTSSRSIIATRDVYTNFDVKNIGKKIVVVNPTAPLDEVLTKIGIDRTDVKLVVIPDIKSLQTLEFYNRQIGTDKEVLTIFEEAFR